ncbi:MAG: hypothetical protein ACR2MQ_03130 [Gemmatimonadaceae bacterium]
MSDKDRDKDAVDSATADEIRKPDNTTRAGTNAAANDPEQPNPPYTTTGWLTVPKFGSAGGGGLEDEPGPEGD